MCVKTHNFFISQYFTINDIHGIIKPLVYGRMYDTHHCDVGIRRFCFNYI